MHHARSVRHAAGRVSGALVLFLVAGTAGGQIAWKSETAGDLEAVEAIIQSRENRFFPQQQLDREQLRTALAAYSQPGVTRRAVMRFSTLPSPEERAKLETQGIMLLSPVGGQAFFVRVDADRMNVDALAGNTTIADIDAIRPEWKTDPQILQNRYPAHAKSLNNEGDEFWAALVQWHADVSLKEATRIAEQAGLKVRSAVRQTNALVVEGPSDVVRDLIDREEVQWVEPPIPPLSELNSQVRTALQIGTVESAPYGLDGSGITVMVYDGGVARQTHDDFEGRLTIHDGAGLSNHATHVSGTIGGGGVANSTHRGVAPEVLLRSFGFQTDGTGVFLYTNPGDIISDYTTAFVNLGAVIANNSIGTNVEINGFPCSYQGDYTLTCATIDSIIRDGINGTPIRIMWAGGNERQGSSCDVEGYGDYYSIAPPSGAKNHIAIGAINSDNLAMTSFSSWGPTDDGRTKPDLVAPGCASSGGVISTSSSSDTAYSTACGTSMACPAATGAASLVLQDFQEQFPGAPLMSNQLLKAILIQSADDHGTVGPDFTSGYGLIDTPAAVDLARSGNYLEDEVSDGATVLSRVTVAPGQSELRITLVWDDAPGTPNSGAALVNDLDLVVRSPSGDRRYPWTLDPLSPTTAAVRNTEDRRNNVEQVFVEGPAAGEWTVEVVGHSVPAGSQGFALAASEPLEQVGLQVLLLTALPDYLPAGQPLNVQVQITSLNDTVVPGSPAMYFRNDSGDSYSQVSLTNISGEVWEADIAPQLCDSAPQFYFSVEGAETGNRLLPFDGANTPFAYTIGVLEDVFLDDFTSDQAWTVGEFDGGQTASSGNWTRMDPESTSAQPEDATVGDLCWVTDGRAGTSLGTWDIDDGLTTLTSPVIDLAGKANTTISYKRWYSNDTGASPNSDTFRIDISNDGGSSWVNVETVGPTGPGTSGGWSAFEFNVSDYVTPTSSVRVRFTAEDADPGSVVEAAVDDFQVVSFECIEPQPTDCEGDINGDDVVDLSDFNILGVNFGAGPGALPSEGDLNGDGFVDLSDFNILGVNFGNDCTN